MTDVLGRLVTVGPKVVNVGLVDFAASLRSQGAQVVEVSWRPPASGDREMAALLDQLL